MRHGAGRNKQPLPLLAWLTMLPTLGVTSTASEDEIRAAYATYRAKYAADQVAHLSQDLQDRYRHKAAAVERAFQALTRAS